MQVAFGQSKYYSDNLSQNIRRGIRQKLRRGEYFGTAPFGYIANPRTRDIEPHPIKSKIVKKAFEEFATGECSTASMSKRLAFGGILNSKGNEISKSLVYRMFSNLAYLGIITIKGETYEGTFEPLIEKNYLIKYSKS